MTADGAPDTWPKTRRSPETDASPARDTDASPETRPSPARDTDASPETRPSPARDTDASPALASSAPRRPPRLALALALAAGWLVILFLGRAGGRIAPILGLYAVGAMALAVAAWPEARARLEARWSELALGLGAGVVLALAAYPVFASLVQHDPGLAPQVARLYTLAGARGAAAIWLLVAALAEEVLFRGLLYDLLADLGPTRAVGLTALVYGAAQLGTGAWQVAAAAAALGLVWGMLRASTGRVVAPLLAHLVFSTVVLVILPLVRF